MRYAVIMLTFAMMLGSVCFGQTKKPKSKTKKKQPVAPVVKPAPVKQPLLAEWGKLLSESAPNYKVEDPNAAGGIKVTITTEFFRENKTNKGLFQVAYTVTQIIAENANGKTTTKSIDTIINDYYSNGVKTVSNPIDFPIQPSSYNSVMSMAPEGFREKYKEYLPPPLENWEIKASSSASPEVTYKVGSSITVTQATYITRETSYQGRHLKIRYKDVLTTQYDKKTNTIKTTEEIEEIEELEVNMSGFDVPWKANGGGLRIHLGGSNKGIDGMGKEPKDAAGNPLTYLIQEQTLSAYFDNKNSFHQKYQDLYWQYIHKPVITLTVNYTPSYAYRTNRIVEQQFTHTADQQNRSNTEEGRYGQILELHLGGTWKKVHSWYLGYMYLQNGFKQTGITSGIDWTTGLNNAGTEGNGLLTHLHGLSLGYNYTGYSSTRFASAVLDAGVFYLHDFHHDADGLRWNQLD